MSPVSHPLDGRTVEKALAAAGAAYAGVQTHASVGSTNALAREAGILWHVVAADEQTAGRGRLGRSWSTPPGSALAVSVLVPATRDPAWLPLATGLAVLRAVEGVTGLDVSLKWPNDVLLPADADRKVCGILCELVPEGVVIGAGINVAQSRDELPVDTATSLALAGARDVDRASLLTAYLTALADLHAHVSTDPASVRSQYVSRCSTVGMPVDVHLPDRTHLTGRATGVDAHGRLVVATTSGRRAVAAGDVVHVRPGPAPDVRITGTD